MVKIQNFNVKKTKACKTHRQIYEVYGPNTKYIRNSMVISRVRHFNEGREIVHDNERCGCLSLIENDFIAVVNAEFFKNRHSTIMKCSLDFF